MASFFSFVFWFHNVIKEIYPIVVTKDQFNNLTVKILKFLSKPSHKNRECYSI